MPGKSQIRFLECPDPVVMIEAHGTTAAADKEIDTTSPTHEPIEIRLGPYM